MPESERERVLAERVHVRRNREPFPVDLDPSDPDALAAEFMRQVRVGFEAGATYGATVFVLGNVDPVFRDRGRHVFVVEPKAEAPMDRDTKAVVDWMVRGLCAACEPVATMMVSEAYLRSFRGKEAVEEARKREGQGESLATDPEAREVLFAAIETKTGFRSYMAPIVNISETVRQLLPFEPTIPDSELEGDKEVTAGGRFFNYIPRAAT